MHDSEPENSWAAPIGGGGHDPPLLEAKGPGGHNFGIIYISHIALITPLH